MGGRWPRSMRPRKREIRGASDARGARVESAQAQCRAAHVARACALRTGGLGSGARLPTLRSCPLWFARHDLTALSYTTSSIISGQRAARTTATTATATPSSNGHADTPQAAVLRALSRVPPAAAPGVGPGERRRPCDPARAARRGPAAARGRVRAAVLEACSPCAGEGCHDWRRRRRGEHGWLLSSRKSRTADLAGELAARPRSSTFQVSFVDTFLAEQRR